jgi:hypothetical protein
MNYYSKYKLNHPNKSFVIFLRTPYIRSLEYKINPTSSLRCSPDFSFCLRMLRQIGIPLHIPTSSALRNINKSFEFLRSLSGFLNIVPRNSLLSTLTYIYDFNKTIIVKPVKQILGKHKIMNLFHGLYTPIFSWIYSTYFVISGDLTNFASFILEDDETIDCNSFHVFR